MPLETFPELLLAAALELVPVPPVLLAVEPDESEADDVAGEVVVDVLPLAVLPLVVLPLVVLPLVVAAFAWLPVWAIWCTSSPKPATDAATTPETA